MKNVLLLGCVFLSATTAFAEGLGSEDFCSMPQGTTIQVLNDIQFDSGAVASQSIDSGKICRFSQLDKATKDGYKYKWSDEPRVLPKGTLMTVQKNDCTFSGNKMVLATAKGTLLELSCDVGYGELSINDFVHNTSNSLQINLAAPAVISSLDPSQLNLAALLTSPRPASARSTSNDAKESLASIHLPEAIVKTSGLAE